MNKEQLREKARTFDQRSKYHDLLLLDHIDKAVAYAKEHQFSSAVIEALEWHDFGKLFCFQASGEDLHFANHAAESERIYCEQPNYSEYVADLIKNHQTPITKKLLLSRGLDFCKELYNLQEADRFAHSLYAKMLPEHVEIVALRKATIREFERKVTIIKRLQHDFDYLSALGYEVVGVFLQGSQNYSLDTELSDIDTKAIVLPKFEDFLLLSQPVSMTLEIGEKKEHIDVKDIRIMFETFAKANVNFLEILFTKYKLINKKYAALFAPLFARREDIAFYDKKSLYNSIAGMALQKKAALKHPYPTIITKIEKFGYDPKQLHHIIRLEQFIARIVGGECFGAALTANHREYLLAIKYGSCPLLEAEQLANTSCNSIVSIKNKQLEVVHKKDETVPVLLASCKIAILRAWFKEELAR